MDEKMNEMAEIKPNQVEKKPDEAGAIVVHGHIKIFDPETNEILVNERA